MPRLRRNRLALCLTLVASQISPGVASAQSVLIHLRNGDRLSGQLLSEDPVRITISNAILGRISVPLTQIDRREPLTNAVALTGRAIAQSNSAANPPPPAIASKPAGPKHWSGEVLLGTDLGFGEKSRELYTGRLKFNYARAPLRNNFDYLFTYGRAEGELSANRMDGQMKTDYDLSQKVYLYFLGGAGYDEIRKIDWRYEVGPGAGYHLIKLTNFVLRAEAGFHFQVQNFQDDPQKDIYYHRLAQDLKWNLGSLFSFDEKVEYLPEWNDFRVYKLRMEGSLRYWLRSNLSLNFTVINLYDTVTAQGVGQNDLQLRSSVGLKF